MSETIQAMLLVLGVGFLIDWSFHFIRYLFHVCFDHREP